MNRHYWQVGRVVGISPRTRAVVLRVGQAALLVGILAAALGLRLYGIRWGLPYTDHPDEPSAVNRVFGMLRRNDWDPHFFGKPSLYYYALRLVFAAHLHYGMSTGLYQGIQSLPLTTDRYVTTPEFFVWGRVLTALLGIATVALLYVLGKHWWNKWVGVIAALLLAVSPFHVRNSQYITQDVPMAFTALIALLASLAPLRKPDWRAYALAGAAIGLATSTKYNVALVAVTLVVVHVQVWGWRSLREGWRLVLAGVVSMAAFAVTTPYAVLSAGEFLQGVRGQYTAYNPTGASSLAPITVARVVDYAQFYWEAGLYPLPALAAVVGIAVVVVQRNRAAIALLAFVLVYNVVFMAQQVQFDRNLLAVVPVLFLMSAIGIISIARWIVSLASRVPALRTWPNMPLPLAVGTCLLLGAVVYVPAGRTITQDRFYSYLHSKVRAGNYVKTLPQGAPIAVALNSAQWPGRPFIISTKDVTNETLEWYKAQGFRYLIANVKDSRPERYTVLRAGATVIQTFPGDKQGQPGPLMEALDLGQHFDQLAIEHRTADFGARMRLLGFQRGVGDLRTAFTPLDGAVSVQPGQVLQLNLYWRALAGMDRDYAIFLHLLNEAGQTVAQRDTVIRAADYPTSHWVAGEVAVDLADFPLPAELPGGKYQLQLGVYDMQSGQRLEVPGTSDNSFVLLSLDLPGK